MNQTGSGDIVVLSLEPWDDVWRRNQLLVDRLLAFDPHRRFLFVEPAYDLRYSIARRIRPEHLGLRQLRERLWAFRPLKVLPSSITASGDRLMAAQIDRAARRVGLQRGVLWVNDSSFANYACNRPEPVVYDITDDWLLADASPARQTRLERDEHRMLECADEVVVCSPALLASRSASREVHLVPNGVDVAHFTRPRPRPADLPAGPVAVYVGTLHDERVDVDLIADLARSSVARVALVGPDNLAPASSHRLVEAGVDLLGPRPYESVPAYLQHADVVVVPHVVSPFTESLDPIKAYECVAVGTTTVTTPVAGFRDLGPPIVVADRDSFVSTVRRCIERPPDFGHRSSAPTWDDRARSFDDVLRRAAKGSGEPR